MRLLQHLMLRFVDGANECSGQEFLRIVEPLYKQYVGVEKDYDGPQGFENAQRFIMEGMYGELKQVLQGAKDGKVFLMDADARATRRGELEARGLQLIEHKEEHAE